jgi:hypothetical protein
MTAEPDALKLREIAAAMERCGLSWVPDACLIGNVTATQIVQASRALLSRLDAPGRDAVVEECAVAVDNFGDFFDLPSPDDGPFTQMDKIINQCKVLIAAKLRALKATPAPGKGEKV